MLRIAVDHHVADVEVGLDVVGAHLVQEVAHLKRAEQELVPHVLQADDHAGGLRVGSQLLHRLQRAVVGHVVGHDRAVLDEVRAHAAGHDQDCAAAQQLCRLELEAHGVLGHAADFGVVAGQGRAPVQAGGQGADLDAQLVGQRAEGLDLLVAAVQAQLALRVQAQLKAVIAGLRGQAHRVLLAHTRREGPGVDTSLH